MQKELPVELQKWNKFYFIYWVLWNVCHKIKIKIYHFIGKILNMRFSSTNHFLVYENVF